MPSAIGDVLPALGVLVTTAVSPTRVYVGPKPTSENAREFLCVGFDPDGTGDGVTTDQTISPMGNDWVDESGDVTCTVVCWSGSTDTAPLLARADDLLDLVDAALKADPRLGGVLVNGAADGSKARVLGRGGMQLSSAARGASARLTFTIHYSTLLVG